MNVRYRITLSDEERATLLALVARGRPKLREVKRAQLLMAAEAGSTDAEIARTVSTSKATVYRTRRCFVEEGLQVALHDAPPRGGPRNLSGPEEVLLVATACAAPPAGRASWTLDLLAGEMVRLTAYESLSGDTIGSRLSENKLKLICRPLPNSRTTRSSTRSSCANRRASASKTGRGCTSCRAERRCDECSGAYRGVGAHGSLTALMRGM